MNKIRMAMASQVRRYNNYRTEQRKMKDAKGLNAPHVGRSPTVDGEPARRANPNEGAAVHHNTDGRPATAPPRKGDGRVGAERHPPSDAYGGPNQKVGGKLR